MSTQRSRDENERRGVTRRGFLGTVGAGAVAAVASGDRSAEAHAPSLDDDDTIPVTLDINGAAHSLRVEPRWSLLYVLRELLGMTGTKVGCERGECGACTVLIDDVPRYACLTLAVEAEGRRITTVEGLLDGEELGDVQQAFVDEDAYQCGYCTPGQVVAAEGLPRSNPSPSTDEIRHGMSGNLCRCAAYTHIVKAVERAAAGRRPQGGAS